METRRLKSKKALRLGAVIVLLALALTLTSCLPGDGKNNVDKPAGFFTGIWHGWIAPISVIVGLFNKSIRVYEVNNTGWWYDLGFYMAVISGFGGLAFSRKSRRRG